MSGERKDTQSRKSKHRRLVIALAILAVVCLLGYLAVECVLKPTILVWECQDNLFNFHLELFPYPRFYGGEYPAPERWCDLVWESGIRSFVHHESYRCPANKDHKCSYAMNPNCEPNSPSDMVLLFETKDGWNQFGGPELLTFDNHGGKGCNILFNDGHIEFIRPSQVSKLKWNVEKAKNE